jgi:excisionase family DNA binding protein
MNIPPTIMLALDASTTACLAQGIAEHLMRSDALAYNMSASVDEWLRTADAADYLSISKSELHRLAAAGTVPHEQDGPGCALYFKRSDLDAWRRAGGRRRPM